MFKNKKIHVGIVAYNEEKSIKKVVEGFKREKIIDKIIVIDNNSKDRTGSVAKKAGAVVIKEERQGYGFACQTALKQCLIKGDIIILTEGDSSFLEKDLHKFLAYIDDADMVLGTRTTRELIAKNAKMNNFLLFGNIFIAKLIQLRFFGRVRLTDVGCTFRMIKKAALKKIIKDLKVGGSHFSPEMIIISLKKELKVIEIPINYKERVGESKITSTTWKSFKLGLRMIKLAILK